MHSLLRELIQKETPAMNRLIVDGIAVSHMAKVDEYVHNVMADAAKSFPQGIKYEGCERCTPEEEFKEVTRVRNNKRLFDISRSDRYYMKYMFSYKGKMLPPRYMYLPFLSDGGMIYLSGTRYIVSPVLTDKVISPGTNNVFVRLMRDKVTFERLHHSMMINGSKEPTQVLYSSIYRKTTKGKKVQQTTKAFTCLTHYLLCRYGFTEMFQKFCGFVPIVTNYIDHEKYSKDSYVICNSTQIKPKTALGEYYKPSNINIIIPIEHWNAYTKSFVSEMFYIIDHFPTRVSVDYLDKKDIWMILLGHIIFSGIYGEGKLYTQISEHFNSLNEYVDRLIIIKLEEIGYHCNDFYELLALVIKHFNVWTINGSEQLNSLYNKELSVLYHVMFEITSAIFRTGFNLNKLATKKELTEKEIIEVMNKNLKPGLIYSLTRSHVNMSTVNYSGDGKFFNITSMMVPQASATNKISRTRKSRSVTNDPTKKIHESIAEIGSYLNLPKASPRGDSRINPYALVDDKGVVRPNPKFADIISRIGKMFKGNLI